LASGFPNIFFVATLLKNLSSQNYSQASAESFHFFVFDANIYEEPIRSSARRWRDLASMELARNLLLDCLRV